MSSTTFDGDGIGPQIDLDDVALPPHVGERLAAMYDREGRIDTYAEWVAAIREASERTQDEPPTPDDLCRIDGGAHTVEIDGETESFVCVLDPLVVPFLRETPGTVRSVTPAAGRSVTVEVETDRATVEPASAVISLGVSRNADVDGTPTHADVYTETCPYIHAFASVDEYERWADDVDAATTSLDAATGVAVARELARELFARD